MLRKIENGICPFGDYLSKKLEEWSHLNQQRRNVRLAVADINRRTGYDVLTGTQNFHTWIRTGPCLQGSGYPRDREKDVFSRLFGEDWPKVLYLCPNRIQSTVSNEAITMLQSITSLPYVFISDLFFVEMDLEIRRHWGD